MRPYTISSIRNAPLKVLLAIALLVLCSLSFLLINRIYNMSQAANLVNHTNRVRLALSETLSRLKDAESGSRGFIMSKDSVFLNNYLNSERDLNDHLNRLTLLVRDNPAQVKQTDTLKTLVHKRLTLLQTVLAAYMQQELSGQELRGELLKGKEAMDEVNSRLVMMENAELQLLAARMAKSERYIITTPLFAIGLTAVALLLILFAFSKLNRKLNYSDKQGNLANKKAEKAGSLLENAEQIAGIASWEWNLTTQNIERSNNLYRLYGYEPGYTDPSVGSFLQLIDEEDRNNLLQQLEQFRAQGQGSYTYHFWITRKDGARRHFKCICHFSVNEKGENIVTGTTQDITEEYLLRQEAQKRAYLVEQVVEHNIDLIGVMDTQMRVQLWNKAYEEAFGVSRHEILGKKITDVFPYLGNDIKTQLTKAALEGRETIRKQLPFQKDQKTGEISFIPLKDINGNIEGALTIIHDITELKKASEQIKESNIRFEQAEEAGNIGSYKRNTKTGEGTVSNNLYRLFGIEPGSITTPTIEFFLQMVHPEDQKRVVEIIKKNADAGIIHPVQCRIVRKDGLERYVRVSAMPPVLNEKGEPVIYGSVADVTELKNAERELMEKNEELQRTNQELASFNYIASHDLQEPLRKIQTFCDFLKQTEKGLSVQGLNNLLRMELCAARMRDLINDLLSYSMIDMVKAEKEPVDLNSVLKDAISSLRKLKHDKEFDIIAEDLPEVQGIPFLLQQLMENIISNAIKFSAADTKPEVSVTCTTIAASQAAMDGLRPDQAYYQLSFKDNGIGFEEQYVNKIFELFQRLHPQNEYKGTGLGLATCRKIVQKHGGHIQASSQPGKGASFDIFLPH